MIESSGTFLEYELAYRRERLAGAAGAPRSRRTTRRRAPRSARHSRR